MHNAGAVMKTNRLKALIVANAKEVERMRTDVRAAAAALREQDPESKRILATAYEVFEARIDALTFPGGYSDAFERIDSGDPAAIEAALCFLELRPRFLGSGYMYKHILRKMKLASLPSAQACRLAKVIAAMQAFRAANAGAPSADG